MVIDNIMNKYVVITPAKNESKYISFTLDSMIRQSIKPVKWIIVDDGSLDDTCSIVLKAIQNYSWITLLKKNTNDKRAPGSNVVNAFYFGLRSIKENYDYVVKLDADLKFEEDYFEKLIEQFKINNKLGISGGYCINSIKGNKKKIDSTPEYHVRGATKMYRKKCFDDIGGLMPVFGWDGIDEMKAMMLGWETKSFKNITVLHLRATGQETGPLKYAWRRGVLNYYMGYNPLYLILSCLNNFSKRPYILFGLSLFAGYLYSVITQSDRINDENLINFIKKFQLNRINILRLLFI
ncbi:MAG: glycosyltransferase family A protein [Ignavibacteriaceae bacterium]|nr:glycosyltransferase family A protein [Ignavibacteriaceae bacterium]